MTEIMNRTLTGERALFAARDLRVTDCTFSDGESPLKHSSGIVLSGTAFRWKYPLWYSRDISAADCVFDENARAGIWYTDNISLSDTDYSAQKGFRRCTGVELSDVRFPNAAETLWDCRDISMKNASVKGDYFCMNCKNIQAENLDLDGNYSFDGAENVTLRDSRLIGRDAFWNSRNVTAVNCFISGEYLGWNSENLTLIDCTVESLQGLCFVKGLTIKNCRFVNTTLALEYSSDISALITGGIDSIKNPASGVITADSIGELIMEPERVDVNATVITIKGGK